MLGVLVRKKYAAALNRRVLLGVVSYSNWASRSHRDRTRLIAALGPPFCIPRAMTRGVADRGLSFTPSNGAGLA